MSNNKGTPAEEWLGVDSSVWFPLHRHKDEPHNRLADFLAEDFASTSTTLPGEDAMATLIEDTAKWQELFPKCSVVAIVYGFSQELHPAAYYTTIQPYYNDEDVPESWPHLQISQAASYAAAKYFALEAYQKWVESEGPLTKWDFQNFDNWNS